MSTKVTKEYKAIALIILSSLMFACLNFFIKIASIELDPVTILGYRNLFICLFVTAYILMYERQIKLPKVNKSNILKGLADLISIPIWSIAIIHIKIGEAVAISYITPIISIILAVLIIGEKITKEKTIAVSLGLFGAYIVLFPTSGVFNYYSLFIVFSSLLWATSNVLTKKLTLKQNAYVIVLYTNLISFLIASPLFLQNCFNVNGEQLIILFALSFFAYVANLCVAKAYTLTEMTNLLPLDYTRLIFTTIIGYTLLGEVVGANTFIGTAIIMTASLYIVRKVKKHTQSSVSV
jgi:drug/metabolite transporter (DMT)-like permease